MTSDRWTCRTCCFSDPCAWRQDAPGSYRHHDGGGRMVAPWHHPSHGGKHTDWKLGPLVWRRSGKCWLKSFKQQTLHRSCFSALTSLLCRVLCEPRICPVSWLRWPVRETCATASSPSTPATQTRACGGFTWCVNPAPSTTWCTSLRWSGECAHTDRKIRFTTLVGLPN